MDWHIQESSLDKTKERETVQEEWLHRDQAERRRKRENKKSVIQDENSLKSHPGILGCAVMCLCRRSHTHALLRSLHIDL
ncbi:hypothetical protein MHYP_G00011970 [Metynnis hypsauchen]